VTLAVALLAMATLYSVVVPQPQLVMAQTDPGLVAAGQAIYANACISCHGTNLEGVSGRGPSLIGAGDAAVYFQVSTGRMPSAQEGPQARRKAPEPDLDPATPEGAHNLAALGAYVQAHGGGPQTPPNPGGLVGADPTRGGELFRINCTQCHNFTGRGGALLGGNYAPDLGRATPEQIYTAMLSGPQAMPRFTDRQLNPQEKADIIAYVLAVRGQNTAPGGLAIGEIGPVSEGLVAFLVGLVALVGFTAWLGSRS
jgi:ubiquinol-cytochrome c reductase cytochrome c subunit